MVTSTALSLRIPAPTHLALDASGTRRPLPHTIAMRARRSVSVPAAASPPDDATGSTGVPVQASRDPISLPRPLTSGDLMEANADDLKVAYQGCPGAYSEAAAKKAYPSCQTMPCEYFDTAFQAVENWVANRAVLPLENSLGGSIHRNYDLLLRHRLHIVGEVDNIPLNFMSLGHYFKSYHAPLIEETRSDLCSCLELIAEAPSSKILSMEVAGKSRSYFMDVDFWDNGAGFSTETYTARNGDIFILSSINPEAAEDFKRYGVTYCLAI